MVGGDTVIGWLVDPGERAALLVRLPPTYSNVVAHHVTLRSKSSTAAPLPPAATCEIVGRANDGAGVEAMVVKIDGTTDRPDGSTFHITWSLAEGRRARESNDVIAARGWSPLPEPIPVTVRPARF